MINFVGYHNYSEELITPRMLSIGVNDNVWMLSGKDRHGMLTTIDNNNGRILYDSGYVDVSGNRLYEGSLVDVIAYIEDERDGQNYDVQFQAIIVRTGESYNICPIENINTDEGTIIYASHAIEHPCNILHKTFTLYGMCFEHDYYTSGGLEEYFTNTGYENSLKAK